MDMEVRFSVVSSPLIAVVIEPNIIKETNYINALAFINQKYLVIKENHYF